MSDGLNDARALRITEIMTDFRALQYYLSQLRPTPSPEEYYLEGYSVLRECVSQAQAILAQPFAASGAGAEREQLRGIIKDAAVRRFQCQRLYLRAHAALRWVEGRKKGGANVDAVLRSELMAITDSYVESTLRNQDAAQGKWLAEDPTLVQVQQILSTR